MTVRVRIAPSPTGLMHVGNARAGLFNWLFARHHQGTFIVRIDDTDFERSERQFEEDIIEGLRWMGLGWDEGVEVGGPYGSYRQSDRLDHYRVIAQGLVDDGFAYYDDRSPEELDRLRARAQAEKKHPNTYIRRPQTQASSGAIRFSVASDQSVEFLDLVREEVRFESESIDDFVILRSDGMPTYHLASTVDDIDYQISHVIRGEDLLSSTPKHILLARALGADLPAYAHLPLLFGPDGRKLSKRHGDVSLRAYREGGYLPEAMVNFMSLLGWSLDAERTLFTVEEAISAFDLGKVSKNPAIFDIDKLQWMSGEYMRAMPAEEFCRRVRPYLTEGLGRPLDDAEWAGVVRIAPLVQERVKLLSEAVDQVRFLFVEELVPDQSAVDKVMADGAAAGVLTAATEALTGLEAWDKEPIEAALRGVLERLGLNARKGLQPIRVAVTGSTVSPPLFESIAALGRERTIERLWSLIRNPHGDTAYRR